MSGLQTVQLPFFLNSGQGRNRSSTGHAFDVELSPPIAVPKNARNTRLFVQEASAVYSFPNVTATTNRVYIYYRSNLFTLQVTPGLYATIDEMQAGINESSVIDVVACLRIGNNHRFLMLERHCPCGSATACCIRDGMRVSGKGSRARGARGQQHDAGEET